MFDKYQFSKNWNNPADFPTVETDESKVRADAQLLHDETKNALHKLIDDLAAETAGESIGVQGEAGASTLQAVLQALLLVKHSHGNLEELERLVAEFNGMGVTQSLVADASKIPTSQAVIDQLDALGAGDMAARVYDPTGKKEDIFAYADAAANEKAPLVHTHDASAINAGVLPPERGGTGKATLNEALIALLASGDIYVPDSLLVDTLPTSAPKNKIILKRVT